MSISQEIIKCTQCNEEKLEWLPMQSFTLPTICKDCENENQYMARKKHLDDLGKESIEIRLSKLEEWMYDMQCNQNKFGGKY